MNIMNMQIKLDGISVNRISQDAVITNGTNSITQRNLLKKTQGTEIIGDGHIQVNHDLKHMMDFDMLDHCTWNGNNWTI